MTAAQDKVHRLEAWVDGSAICVIAVSACGDPLDLGEEEVEDFIDRLRACVVKVRGE